MSIEEKKRENICYSKSYLNIPRTDELLLIEIVVNYTRTIAEKKSLYVQIAHNLVQNIKIRPEDVFINLIEVRKENWSFGHGIAQYA